MLPSPFHHEKERATALETSSYFGIRHTCSRFITKAKVNSSFVKSSSAHVCLATGICALKVSNKRRGEHRRTCSFSADKIEGGGDESGDNF